MTEATSASNNQALSDGTIAQSQSIAPVAVPLKTPARPNLRTIEHQKTPEERAEDIAYTINHAVSCATTDIFIVPTISALPTMFGQTNQKFNWSIYTHELSGYLRGEIIGDFSAVPLTIMVQRFFPGFMDMVGRIVDPVAKPIFQHGAKNAAKRWGGKHGLEATDQQVVDHAEEIYQHEIKHLPQAVVWNMFSFPLGVIGQKLTGHGGIGNWKEISRNKLLGTAISNILLIGGRALVPDKAEKFDRMDGKYVIRPMTRAISGLAGIESKVVDHMDKKAEEAEQRENGSWRARVQQDQRNATVATQPSI